jgi:hypothetical protein
MSLGGLTSQQSLQLLLIAESPGKKTQLTIPLTAPALLA